MYEKIEAVYESSWTQCGESSVTIDSELILKLGEWVQVQFAFRDCMCTQVYVFAPDSMKMLSRLTACASRLVVFPPSKIEECQTLEDLEALAATVDWL